MPVKVAVAATGMLLAAFVWRFLTFTGFSNDHYAHLALAQQMLLGERPIRDFSDPGWPLTYLISAGAWQLTGGTMAVEWFIVTSGFALGAAFSVVAAHRLSGSLVIALLVATLELLAFPRTYSYPKMLAYGAAGWAMLALAASPSRSRVILMGALTVAAFLLRHDHGAYIGVASVICVALAVRGNWRLALNRAVLLVVAGVVFAAPWALYVALNGGLVDYFDRAFEYARIEANATNLKAWPRFTLVPNQPVLGVGRPNRPLVQVEWNGDVTDARQQSLEQRFALELVREHDGENFYYVWNATAENLRALADDPSVAGTAGIGRAQRPLWRELLAYASPLRLAPALHTLQNAQTWLYWLYWLLPAVSALVMCWRLYRRHEQWSGELAAIAGLIVLTLLVNSGFLRDPLSDRLADAIVPPALLGAWLAGNVWSGRWRIRTLQMGGRGLTLAALFVTTASVAAIAGLPERIDYTGIRDGIQGVRDRAHAVTRLLASPHRQTIAPPSRVSAGLMPFFGYLDRCTSPADQLIVTSDYADILVLAGRGFASDGVTFGVWYSSVAHQAGTIAAMRARPALFTILTGETQFRARYPQVADYVASDFKPMTEIDIEEVGRVQILVHRDRLSDSVDRETGWPCFR
jgi:hypothetical protein